MLEELEVTFAFCSERGSAVDKEEILIRHYFRRGFSLSYPSTCQAKF